MARIYQAIAQCGDGVLIIDSSKFPADALLLARQPDVELSVIHLVRDPRAVAHSWQTKKASPDRPGGEFMRTHGVTKSTATWVLWNALSDSLIRRSVDRRYVRLRYEDLVLDPSRVVEEALRSLGFDFEVPRAEAVSYDENHTISGNPGRFSGAAVPIATDLRWIEEMSVRDRLVCSLIAAPLVRRYDYKLVPPRHIK